MNDIVDFLDQVPLFAGLFTEELEALAEIAQEYEFEDGAVLAYQRDVADSLYIVRSGRLFARAVDEYGIVRDARSFFAGDCFGDEWLFASSIHPYTVRGAGSGRIIIITNRDFMQFLNKNPGFLENLAPQYNEMDQRVGGLSEAAWEEALKSQVKADKRSRAISLLPDELVEFYARRSKLFLLLQLLPPIFLFLLAPISAVLLAGQSAGLGVYFRLGLPVIFIIVSGLWFAFRLLDWTNDYFVITNKHLAHREFSLRTFRTRVEKIPIDQIQSVEVERPSFIANLFNFGTARITTAAQNQALYFDNIDDPGEVERTLGRLKQRVQALESGREQATMRHSIEQHFQVKPALRPVTAEDDMVGQPVEKPGIMSSLLRRYAARVVNGDAITYRKHFFVLLSQIAWPFLGVLFLILASYVLLGPMQFGLGQIGWILSIFFLVDIGWLIWQVEDWRNDTFQLTSQYVVDIDRRPFGFGESRKLAELSNVQNVNSDRPSFWATVFNFGNVIIETAGATADITFESVSNPNKVQSDVFQRRDQYRRQAQVRQGEQRRKEYAVLLDVYQQAREQERIPRRTPPPGEMEMGN